MTRVAGYVPVRARQFEVRLVVIELSAAPGRGAMALAARPVELSAVHVVVLMTIDAIRGCLAPGDAGLVAAIARESRVRAFEREVGQVMVELPTAQLHDIGFPTLVLGMACTTLTYARVGHAPVIAVMRLQISGDVLVAVETE
jgi:hypothetical protein